MHQSVTNSNPVQKQPDQILNKAALGFLATVAVRLVSGNSLNTALIGGSIAVAATAIHAASTSLGRMALNNKDHPLATKLGNYKDWVITGFSALILKGAYDLALKKFPKEMAMTSIKIISRVPALVPLLLATLALNIEKNPDDEASIPFRINPEKAFAFLPTI